jgi:hypothetical protein
MRGADISARCQRQHLLLAAAHAAGELTGTLLRTGKVSKQKSRLRRIA